MIRSRLALFAAPAVLLTACAASPSTPANSGEPAPSQSAAAGGLDAKGLVAAMWTQLGESSQQQLCDIFASRGAEAGQVFVAGAESDPKAELLTADDKGKIADEAAALLEVKCVGKA